MILYSIIPGEVVMNNDYYNSHVSENTLEIDYMGERVVVSPLENNRYVIDRLISTSPKAYLNPAFQPGTIIDGNLK